MRLGLLSVFSLLSMVLPPVLAVDVQVYLWPVESLLGEDSRVEMVPDLFLRQGRNLLPVRAHRGRAGPAVNAGSSGFLEFVRMTEGPDGEPAPIPYARVNVPGGWTRAMVVLFPERVQEDGLVEALVLDVDPGRIPEGSGVFHNATSTPLRLLVRNNLHSLDPGRSITLTHRDLEESRRGELSRFLPVIYHWDGTAWRESTPGVHYLRPQSGTLFLIQAAPGGNTFRMRPLRLE